MSYPQPREEEHRFPVVWPNAAIAAWLHPTSRAYLQQRGLSREESEQYELAYADVGVWRERVIIPLYEEDRLVGLQGRAILDSNPLRYLTHGRRPLYRSWEPSPERASVLCVVEGFFDFVVVNRVVPTVATLGTMVSPRQLEALKALIREHWVKTVLVWYDAGADVEAFALQLKLQPLVHTLVVESVSKDPGSLTEENVREVLASFP